MYSIIVNSAHEPGYTCLAFSRDGGAEGYVRVWKTDLGDAQEPDVVTEGQEGISSISTSSECWLSGSLDTCVRVYDSNKSTMRGLVTRTVAVPVRCVAIDPKGQRVAVASDELEVKIIELSNTDNVQKLEGHRKGVRKATWHPSGTILTTSGCDGDVIAWDISITGEAKRIETISGLLPLADPDSEEYAYDCSCVWHPSGQYFFMATRTHEIVTISKDTWQRSLTFTSDALTGAITTLAISKNGAYLASATASGVFIWSTTTRKILFQHTPETNFSLVTHLAFSPAENLLAWTDADANLIRWSEPVPSSFPDPVKSHSSSTVAPKQTRSKTDIMDFMDKPLKKASEERKGDEYGLDDDDWMIDDIGLLDEPDRGVRVEELDAKELVSVTKAQSSFQPASTPMINKKRYLAYNMIGVIEVTDQDTHNVVNVEFHDRSTRMNTHFQDVDKCDMASLGERGALYACPEEGEHPAQIMYKPYSAWGSAGEWNYSLPAKETVVSLAAGGNSPSTTLRRKSSDGDIEGNGNVIVATNKGYLRFFSGGGVQRYVWNLGSDVVSMTAGREWVFVVHRDGGTSLDGCQNLYYSLIGLDTFNIVQTGRLPVPRGATLEWIGISEEGAPAIYDSNGLLSILDRFRRPTQARWVPLLDTTALARRQGKDESYWPVGVSGTLLMCIILKGKEKYPRFPRPLIQELEVQIPIYCLEEPSSRMEEKVIRERIHIDFLRDGLGADVTDEDTSRQELNLDKELIQLIQLACKNDKLQRALDLVGLLHNVSSFDLAGKVAEFYHLAGLRSKIQLMKEGRVQKERSEDADEEGLSKQLAPIPASRKFQTYNGKLHVEAFTSATTTRKSLAPAIPVTPFASLHEDADTASIPPRAFDLPSSTWDQPSDGTTATFEHPNEPYKKRKDLGAFESDDQNVQKKRILSATESISNKTPSNPFVKKTQSNPFARPIPKQNETTRSNSFFEKIDEPKTKDVLIQAKQKTASRQATLYDLPSAPIGKKTRTKMTSKNENMNDVHVSESVDGFQLPSTEKEITNSSLVDPSDEIEWPESPPRTSKKLGIQIIVTE